MNALIVSPANFLLVVPQFALIVLSESIRMLVDRKLVSTVALVSSLTLWAAVRAKIARPGSSRQRPEAEAARRARQVSSKMNLHRNSAIRAPTVHSPVVQEAPSAENVQLASSPRLVQPFARRALQVDSRM
jgi:hypothetical protein